MTERTTNAGRVCQDSLRNLRQSWTIFHMLYQAKARRQLWSLDSISRPLDALAIGTGNVFLRLTELELELDFPDAIIS